MNRKFLSFLLLFAGFIPAQEIQTAAMEPSLLGNLPAQKIGPNDLLSISVYGAPELTRTVRVSAEGFIRLPMLKQKVEAKGLMPSDLEEKIAVALSVAEILVDPVVTVTIAEYHSRPISVAGAVKRPVTFQALGKTTLLEALTRAQGLSPDAGTEVVVTRPALAPGGAVRVERIPLKGLIDAADPSLNVTLEGGEEVRVPPVGRVFVVGNVKHPGAYKIEDGFGLTILKALAMAEGLAPYANKQAFIYRRADTGTTQPTGQPAGQPKEVAIDLRKILDRKQPDVPLSANDIFYIPDNRSARLTMTTIDRAVGFMSSTASGILIYSHP
ncbi:MAG TPA: polysaccharide biosynthesis/export family protein [Bryobacteraceae bacterium]|nr:polysaccharide biosynthesis/export family protein [Bryobacteraceae bacterium]